MQNFQIKLLLEIYKKDDIYVSKYYSIIDEDNLILD